MSDQAGPGHGVWPCPRGQWVATEPSRSLIYPTARGRGVCGEEGEDVKDGVEAKCQQAKNKPTG